MQSIVHTILFFFGYATFWTSELLLNQPYTKTLYPLNIHLNGILAFLVFTIAWQNIAAFHIGGWTLLTSYSKYNFKTLVLSVPTTRFYNKDTYKGL